NRKRRKRATLQVNRRIEIKSETCPRCKGKRITRFDDAVDSRLAYDLKFTAGGIVRQVIHCIAARHQCQDCNLPFLPKKYSRLDKYLHGLKSWVIYQHVVHCMTLTHLTTMLEDCFGLRIRNQEFYMMKSLLAYRYRNTYKQILARIVAGGLAQADETHVNL